MKIGLKITQNYLLKKTHNEKQQFDGPRESSVAI